MLEEVLARRADNAALQALIASQAERIAAQEARIAELERRLGLKSRKPRSSDGLLKPPRVRSLREPSGPPTGWQKSHPGETPRRTATADATLDPDPQICGASG